MLIECNELSGELLKVLAERAWEVRERAFIYGGTKVGCAVLAGDGRIFVGCNVEHRFRSHDVHAEVNAIGSMIAAGGVCVRAILVAAKREFFVPCGACMDWIIQFGAGECIVAFSGDRDGAAVCYRSSQLMPFYPH
jgi:cytidine deaminase